MKKQQLKKALKPIINECLKELIFEEGVLSTLMKEAMKAQGSVIVNENKTEVKQQITEQQEEQENVSPSLNDEEKQQIEEAKKAKEKLLSNPQLRQFANIFESVNSIDEDEIKAQALEQERAKEEAKKLKETFASSGYADFLKETIEREKVRNNKELSSSPSLKRQIEMMKHGQHPQQQTQQFAPQQNSIPVQRQEMPEGVDGQPLGSIGEIFDPSRDK